MVSQNIAHQSRAVYLFIFFSCLNLGGLDTCGRSILRLTRELKDKLQDVVRISRGNWNDDDFRDEPGRGEVRSCGYRDQSPLLLLRKRADAQKKTFNYESWSFFPTPATITIWAKCKGKVRRHARNK